MKVDIGNSALAIPDTTINFIVQNKDSLIIGNHSFDRLYVEVENYYYGYYLQNPIIENIGPLNLIVPIPELSEWPLELCEVITTDGDTLQIGEKSCEEIISSTQNINDKKPSYNVYPSLFQNELYIEFLDPKSLGHEHLIKVINLSGECLLTKKIIVSVTLELNQLKKGIYFVTITDLNVNKLVYTQKLFKQ